MDLIEGCWEECIGEMPLKITYPALEGHEWRIVTGFDPKNTRRSYLIDPSYIKFVFNTKNFPSEDYYDYIIVGGGTVGCPLAATLSQSYRVFVLERVGVPYGNPHFMTQERFLATLTEVDTFDSHAQAENGVPNARGHILGGNSSINAGYYSGEDQQFYQKSGVNWDLRVVNEPYEWVEMAVVFRS